MKINSSRDQWNQNACKFKFSYSIRFEINCLLNLNVRKFFLSTDSTEITFEKNVCP